MKKHTKQNIHKRIQLTSFRLPEWQVHFLLSHPRLGGRMIESALKLAFGQELSQYYQKHYQKRK